MEQTIPTLRLPAPPPPPKPLHLTMSRNGTLASRVGLDEGSDSEDEPPVWLTGRSRTSKNGAGAVALNELFREPSREETDRSSASHETLNRHEHHATRQRSTLRLKREASSTSAGGGGTLRGKASTSRRRKASLKGSIVGRTSIFFDPLLRNPLIEPTSIPAPDYSRDETELIRTDALASEEDGDREDEDDQDNMLDVTDVVPAITLHSFAGEAAFGELSFAGGVRLCVEVEDLGGGWSLGYLEEAGPEGRGLIPRGWYAYVESTSSVQPLPTHDKRMLAEVTEMEEETQIVSDNHDAGEPPNSMPPILFSLPTLPPAAVLAPEDRSPSSPASSSTSSTPSPPPTRPLPTPTPSPPPEISSPVPIPPESPSTIRSRSIGRNVVISGIEFEPAHGILEEETSAMPELSRSVEMQRESSPFQPDKFPNMLHRPRSPVSDLSPRNSPSMMAFFESRESKEVDREEERRGELDEEDAVTSEDQEVFNGENLILLEEIRSLEEGPPLEVDKSTSTPAQILVDNSSPQLSLAGQSPDPSTNELDDDTQAARESRWAAVIEQAERNSIYPSGLVAHGEDDDPATAAGFSLAQGAEEPPPPVEDHQDEIHAAGDVEGEEDAEAEEDIVPELPRLLTVGRARDPSLMSYASFSPTSSSLPSTSRPQSFFEKFGLGTLARGSVVVPGPADEVNSRVKDSSTSSKRKGGDVTIQDWLVKGDESRSAEVGEEDTLVQFRIDSGPAWSDDSPPFTVHVHSPTKRSSIGKGEYTTFQLTTFFSESSTSDETSTPEPISVERRYSHFVLLFNLLTARYPVLVIPNLPSKSYAGRFQEQFVETRRRDLERWCCRVGRHPVLRASDEVHQFLSLDSETDLKRLLSSSSPPPTDFFSRVVYSPFNIDWGDAKELGDRFVSHVKALELGGGAKEVEENVLKVRLGFRDTANNLKSLGHRLVLFNSGLALPPVGSISTQERDDEDQGPDKAELSEVERSRYRARRLFVQNDDGALTWKDSCDEALATTKAVQAAAEAISAVGELTELAARDALLPIQELIRELAYPASQHTALLQIHQAALDRHSELSGSTSENPNEAHEESLSRCETILNIVAAEIERAHQERNEDIKTAAEQLIAAQIQFHEQALEKLRFAYTHFEPSSFTALSKTGPRLRSVFERPPTTPRPLPVPSNYGIPSSALGVGASIGISEVLSAGVGSALGIGRTSAPVVYPARASATAGTVNTRTVAEILQNQQNAGSGRPNTRTTWRSSIFGSETLW